jgi:hypothetical protein
MLRKSCWIAALAVTALSTMSVQRADAQSRYRYRSREREPSLRNRELSLTVGALRYDANRKNIPEAALRGTWRLGHYVRSELGATYAIGDVPRLNPANGTEVSASLATATVGIQAEAPFDVLRPYVGIAGGLFGRFDSKGGTRFVRPTMGVPVGVRVLLSDRIGLRGEVRFRFDEHQDGRSMPNLEQHVGLTFGY